MKTSLHLIVLRVTKYSDTKSILSAYTLEHGRMSFAIPSGTGREASRRRALFMPMTAIECVADIRPDREIFTLSEPRAVMPLHNNYSHPAKASICMFLAEVLSYVLREPQCDPYVWHFIADSIISLNQMVASHLANFHICFLYGLGHLLGIAPDTSDYGEGRVFDMIDARFRRSAPMHSDYLTGQEADIVYILSRLTYRNMPKLKLGRAERNRLLDGILHYYTLHYTSLGGIKSLDVLRTLF